MISIRAHLVTLVAVFLALAVGVVLGGGPLGGGPLADGSESRAVPSAAMEQAGGSDAGDAFAGAVAARVLRNRLEERTVAIVAMPGADAEVLDALAGRVADADGRVVGRYDLTSTVLQPGEKQLVDTLGSQLVAEYATDDVDHAASTYERLGQLLALAAASTDGAGEPVGKQSSSVLASLVGADVAAVKGEPRRRAPLVLVVLGEEPADVVLEGAQADADAAELEAATDAILSGLLTGLGDGSVGVVLAGSTASGVDGALARLRQEERLDRVSTLDGVETQVGQVSVPLALGRALAGSFGAYGGSGSDGAVPLR